MVLGFRRPQGVTEVLCEACDQLGWKSPTKIQVEAVPVALQGECRAARLPVSWPTTTEPPHPCVWTKTASLPVVQVKVSLVRCSWEGWRTKCRIFEFRLKAQCNVLSWKWTLRVPVLLWESKAGDDVHIQWIPLHFKHQKIIIKWNSSFVYRHVCSMFALCTQTAHFIEQTHAQRRCLSHRQYY